MGTGIGQTLDKYELLEKVGQGGMAVVYRGLDTSLRREVAVKVLHRHLADHKEARDRFEREAQAVAKLRHENILEIFDFSGNASDESYIVTEFIDGQTLKEFITDHEIKFPEIGAMIIVQVCRALAHAHSVGVLHRDVKPENIMIRNDGVVKLTDFGIAQMLDHQRLTVTGQLLGSPAYMAPEHVEGGKLDFRTDVFAAGIVLYQLATGDLPFRGKNPHEILKRIAECSYTDPRQMNPLIGNQLAGILKKCLAHDKEDRYGDISQLQGALEQYLAASGLSNIREELGRFFDAPVSYEMALRSRLVATLAARGRDRLAEDRNAALELFNRVLTLDPEHREVLEQIERMSRQRRWLRVAALTAAVAVLVGGALAARQFVLAPRDAGRAAAAGPPDAALTAAARFDAAPDQQIEPADAGTVIAEVEVPDAAPRRPGNGHGGQGGAGRPPPSREDAGPAVVADTRRRFTLEVEPAGSEYNDGSGWRAVAGIRTTIEVPAGAVRIEARNDSCCVAEAQTIRADQPSGVIKFSLNNKPAVVIPMCGKVGVTVTISKKEAKLGKERHVPIPDRATSGLERIEVSFYDPASGREDLQKIELGPGEKKDVVCRF